MISFLEVALRNAARGFRVIPLKGKDAFLRGWPMLATTDETTIRQWAAQFPDYNVGACGGSDVIVLDTDRRSRLEEICGAKWAEWSQTYSVSSGRPDRAHYYYLATDDALAFGNKKSAEPSAKGNVFEIKGRGALVVAEGSIHPDTGGVYHITQEIPLIPFPSGLLTVLREFSGKDNLQRDRVPREKISEGGRHDALVKEAGAIQRVTEMDKDILTAHLQSFNEQWLDPPLSDDEVRAVAISCNWTPDIQAPEVTIGKSEKPVTDWRELFHTREQAEHAPPIKFSIDGFLQDDGITGLSAPPGHRKTLMMLNITRSLLTGEPLFQKFKVNSQAERVVYLVPEVSLTPFVHRLRDFELIEHIGNRFFFRTLSASGKLSLSAPELREAIKGAHVFLDTVPRFIEGNENDAEDIRRLGEQLFELLGAGARSVIGAFHMPKGAKKLDYFDLEICVRGSSDLGALLTACWATRLQNEKEPYKCASYVECVKQRDFEACEPFELMSSERGIMTVHDGSPTVKLNGGLGGNRFATNRDGQEKHALAYIKQHPDLSLRELEQGLKGIGIERKKDWIGKKRKELSADGGVCVGSP